MTKTIEQYAEEFADAMVKGALGTRNDYYDSYIKGATDQRKIDIEKAWKVFEKYATYIHSRKGEETCIMTKYKFIEVMEDEQ